jgi:hypothetical protein
LPRYLLQARPKSLTWQGKMDRRRYGPRVSVKFQSWELYSLHQDMHLVGHVLVVFVVAVNMEDGPCGSMIRRPGSRHALCQTLIDNRT